MGQRGETAVDRERQLRPSNLTVRLLYLSFVQCHERKSPGESSAVSRSCGILQQARVTWRRRICIARDRTVGHSRVRNVPTGRRLPHPLFELSQGQSARETAPTIGASLASNVKKVNEL
jgi:hypothetical protein